MKNLSLKNKAFLILILLIMSIIISASPIFAGSLLAPGIPAATSYTLDDIYTRLTTNETATEANHSITNSGTPAGTFHTLKQIYDAIPTIDPTKVAPAATYMGVNGTLVSLSGGYIKTNQTQCYSAAGGVISCTGMDQDGETTAGVARSYTDNSDGTITDNSTGLMWQKCSVGLSGTTCATGSATTMNWTTATTTCGNLSFAGHTDWRLPNVNELQSLANYGQDNPSINSTYFPTTYSGYYWTSTTYMPTKTKAWTIDFSYGDVYSYGKTSLWRVRCVR